MRVIVVDDERRTREVLANHLSWDSLGFDTVIQAEDGVNALELANQTEPDLILTDIMMPRMNGIQLAAEIRELYPRCKLIFLSAYSDIKLFKSAIQLQVVDYVEKPLDLEEIEQVIRKAATILIEEKKIDDLGIEKLKIVMALCNRQFDVSLLGSLLSKQNFLIEGWYSTFILQSKSRDMEQLNQSLYSSARRVGIHLISSVFESPEPHIIAHCRMNRMEDSTKLHSILSEILHGNLETDVPLFIARGKMVNAVERLEESYQTANQLLLRRFFLDEQCLITYEERTGSRFVFDKRLPERIFKLLQSKEKKKALELIEHFISSLKECDSSEISSIRNAFYSILNRLQHDPETPNEYVWELVASIPTISHFQRYLERLIDRNDKQLNKPNDTSTEILDYIRNNLHDLNLGVSSIAQHLYMTPSYICSVFKKNTSGSIQHYITSERMKLAKRYLQSPEVLMQEVASKVGFYDPKYFSKVFKKEVGVTPSEYRKKVMR